uniref:Protein kinase domain-containing protein n=1 Tax=Zooxanthella nutricula TaxID=1333877 RepID=A0A7S2Q4J3_9DINO
MAAPGEPPAKRPKVEDLPELEVRTYQPQRILGKGSFGVVYQAKVLETGDTVAIKAVSTHALSGRSFRQTNGEVDREVQILKELHGHPNIVCLHGAFLSNVGKEPKLNLVLEFLSDTLHRVLKHYNQLRKNMDEYYIKLYQYQLMRGLAFVHGKGIIHVDVKPQNLLLDGGSHTLKICDFGTAKRMSLGKQSLSYACSRYYRAPELTLGATTYTVAVDLWSAGCVFVEMFIGQPLFTGSDGIEQLVEIIKVLGTPTREELRAMNPNYPEYDFTPSLQAHSWEKVFRGLAPREAQDLANMMLRFSPSARAPALHCVMHRFFDSLRIEEKEAHRRLFEFVPEELDWCTATDREKLIPRWVATRVRVKPEPP